jgi:hypothetical protein
MCIHTDYHVEPPNQTDLESNRLTIPCITSQQDLSTQSRSHQPTEQPDFSKRDSPDHDFYKDCYSFPPLIHAFFIMLFALGIKYIVLKYSLSKTAQLSCLPYLYFAVLAATALCRRTPKSRATRIIVWTSCFISYGAVIGYSAFFPKIGIFLATLCPTCLAFVIFDEWNMWRSMPVAN